MDLSDVRIGDSLSVCRYGVHCYYVTVVAVGKRIIVNGVRGLLDSWDPDISGDVVSRDTSGTWSLRRANP